MQRHVEVLAVSGAPTERGDSSARDIGVVIAVAVAIVVVIALIVGAVSDVGKLPRKDFYGFAAGILPVLLLALAWEERAQRAVGPISVGLRRLIVGALGVGEVLAVVAVSGTLEPREDVYTDYTTKTLGLGDADVDHMIEEAALVAPSFGWSLVIATLVSITLALSLVGVLSIAFAPGEKSGQ
ncbi:MAG TPA: hypothetical protein VFP78_02465 [Solirubrobacteraceae bacterium]|nr:hypothetical protein [Solirubrobacteraceae bacterium]